MSLQSIKIDNLNCLFGEKQILSNISLNIEKGKFYSIIGPNGSGKTTLLKHISKSLEVKDKIIYIDDKDINKIKIKEFGKTIALVPQNTNIEFDFSVLDIVLMGRTPYIKRFNEETHEDYKIAENAMRMTNTWHLRERTINSLSGGERQRVIIARAIVQETNIILLDEPISHLDIQHQIEVLDLMIELNKKKGITVVAVLHDINFAIQYSHKVILLKNGEVFNEGIPEEVITNESIESVYGIKVSRVENPVNNKPYYIPISKCNFKS